MAFELRPVAIEQVLTWIKVHAEPLKILTVKNSENVWATDDIQLVISPTLELHKFISVSFGASCQETVECGK